MKEMLHKLLSQYADHFHDTPFQVDFWDGDSRHYGDGQPVFTLSYIKTIIKINFECVITRQGRYACRVFDHMKFTESEDIEAIHAPFQTLNANAVTERWVRTIREECLDKMIILNEQHLRQLLTEYLDYYNERRPHQGLEQDSPLGLNPVSKKAQFAIIRCWVASFEPTIAKLLDWHFHTRIGFLGYGAPEIFEQTDYNAGKLQSNTRRYRMKLCLEN